jgi:hypothetical protein
MSTTHIELPYYGSPISPKGVMEIASFGEPLSPVKVPPGFLNDMSSCVAPAVTIVSPVNKQRKNKNEEDSKKNGTVCGSSAFHTYIRIKPADATLVPILRAVLTGGGGDPQRAWDAIVDDVMINQLHFFKAGKNIFSGQVLGRRVVAIQSSNTHLDEFTVACADADTAAHFILQLRSFGMGVVKEA